MAAVTEAVSLSHVEVPSHFSVYWLGEVPWDFPQSQIDNVYMYISIVEYVFFGHQVHVPGLGMRYRDGSSCIWSGNDGFHHCNVYLAWE